jgi:hypothetical protein
LSVKRPSAPDSVDDDATEALRPPQRAPAIAERLHGGRGGDELRPPRLPRFESLGVYERACAVVGTAAFLQQLDGPAVLVRLDERGGADEAAPWAFPTREVIDAMLEGTSDGDDGDNHYIDPAFTADSDEATATGPAQPPLMTPPARQHASVWVIPRGGGRVGRSPHSAVCVRVRSVSRQHALLGVDDDGVFSVVDLDSDNGTGVNGLALVPGAPHTLRSGDVLALGDTRFLFLDAAGFASHLPALVA